jgi:hypothetical protein
VKDTVTRVEEVGGVWRRWPRGLSSAEDGVTEYVMAHWLYGGGGRGRGRPRGRGDRGWRATEGGDEGHCFERRREKGSVFPGLRVRGLAAFCSSLCRTLERLQ